LDAYQALIDYYEERNFENGMEDTYRMYTKDNPMKAWGYRGLITLYKRQGEEDMVKTYQDLLESIHVKMYSAYTTYFYASIKYEINDHDISLIAVQYPLRPLHPLKKVFILDGSITFVDNEKLFNDAVQRSTYSEYFVDQSAGDFGNLTVKGNQLLSQSITDAIIRDILKF